MELVQTSFIVFKMSIKFIFDIIFILMLLQKYFFSFAVKMNCHFFLADPFWCFFFVRSNCAENIRKHILHTGKHEGVMMYNCPLCSYGTNAPMDFRNHLKETHPDIENPDLAYLHAGIFFLFCLILINSLISSMFFYFYFLSRKWYLRLTLWNILLK